jgi:aspartate-semialdehyde dehydrogenase
MMRELESQTRAAIDPNGDHPDRNEAFPPYAFNLFSHNTPINEHGYNDEEWKVIHESQKILRMPDLRINVTCVRVPVLRAHSETVTAEFWKMPQESGWWTIASAIAFRRRWRPVGRATSLSAGFGKM